MVPIDRTARAMILASAVSFVAGTASAAMAGPGTVAVAEQGITRIAAGSSASATIVTRSADLAEAVATRATRCSGGRTRCSLVDRLTIEVGGKGVEVPPRAVLLLADVNSGELRILPNNRYELVLTGGDAAPAYQARLFFDRRRVRRMDIFSDEAGMVEQSTTFNDVARAFR